MEPFFSMDNCESTSQGGHQLASTLNWLEKNFEFRPEATISRSTIFDRYQGFCSRNGFVPVCKATFGKIIRSKFKGVNSKRLGARGMSKYHYYNIALKDGGNFAPTLSPNLEVFVRPFGSLTVLSSKKSHSTLNTNDYHSIIQSMLTYMAIPKVQPLTNPVHVFINLYKKHCQCLIDSVLSGNFSQTRHYVMHFWQQLPQHIIVYVDLMNSLDAHMYRLLMYLYLTLDNEENLRKLHTIVHLLPVYLAKTFAYIEHSWIIQNHHNYLPLANTTVGEIKIYESKRWNLRIKFTIELIAIFKKLAVLDVFELTDLLAEIIQQHKRSKFDSLRHRMAMFGEQHWPVFLLQFEQLLATIRGQNGSPIAQSLIDSIDQWVNQTGSEHVRQMALMCQVLANYINEVIAFNSLDEEPEDDFYPLFEQFDDWRYSESISNKILLNQSLISQTFHFTLAIQNYLIQICQTTLVENRVKNNFF